MKITDTLMQFERASGWKVFDSVMEQNNIQLVATNFQTRNDVPVLLRLLKDTVTQHQNPPKSRAFIDSTRDSNLWHSWDPYRILGLCLFSGALWRGLAEKATH